MSLSYVLDMTIRDRSLIMTWGSANLRGVIIFGGITEGGSLCFSLYNRTFIRDKSTANDAMQKIFLRTLNFLNGPLIHCYHFYSLS